ncbi:MAG: carbon-nitrogen hydrolase family protein [Ginsengibacter sp.]
MKELKIAIVQHKPVHNHLSSSLEKAISYIVEASEAGAKLIVFGETWLCGYPAWIDYCPEIAQWNNETVKEAFMQLHNNSAAVNGKEIAAICAIAMQHKVVICIGFNEKIIDGPGSGTIYNSFVFINEEGVIVNHHRKLVPTFNEKLLYGQGDAAGLKTIDTQWGKMGGLICWEHWMPLSRQALHNEAELIHIALWPSVNEMHQIAARHYAFEGRCYVIAAAQIMQVKDIPSILTLPEYLKNDPEKYILNGGSCIIDPRGEFIVQPQFDKQEILYCTIENTDAALKEKLTLDTSGHYNRSDIFDFSFNNKRK